MRCWQLDILGIGVDLDVRAAPALLDVLDDTLADLLDRRAGSDGLPSVRRRLVLDLDASTLTDGDKVVATGFAPEDAQEWLWWHLNRIGATHPSLTTVHAGVVATDRGAVVIPGSAGAGKSTLTAALVGAGWRYLSDELAALSRGAALVHAYRRPLSLHPTSARLLRLDGPGASEGHDRPEFVASRRLVRPGADTTTHRAAPRSAVPVMVVFPRFGGSERGTGRDVEPLGPADTLLGLIANGSNLAINGQRAFSTLAALAGRAPGFVVDTTDLPGAVEAVTELAARAQAPGGPELMARPSASVVEVRRGPLRCSEVQALAWPQDRGDLVLFDAATGLTHRLNGPAAEVWLRCDGSRSVGQIAGELGEHFHGADVALQAGSVIDRLVELGAVELDHVHRSG